MGPARISQNALPALQSIVNPNGADISPNGTVPTTDAQIGGSNGPCDCKYSAFAPISPFIVNG